MRLYKKGDMASQIKETTLKSVFTWSEREKKIRLFRILGIGNGGPTGENYGNGGYSYKLSFSVVFKLYALINFYGDKFPNGYTKPSRKHWQICFLGFRIHYRRSYGGWVT